MITRSEPRHLQVGGNSQDLSDGFRPKADSPDATLRTGYDLLSEWDGERHCMEVKTTDTGRDQFYITANECETLRKLARDAWLYRVDLSAGENGAVVMRLQDTMANLDMERFRAVVWEVDVAMFQDESE
ncbi:hypothetical protein CMZ82_08680 [Lysobacteraceae bacterium NML93-0792]|nr:hypothetical protein CMZ82_08680 [Xanthomonadaceae bacterium NML93-0792]PBS15625.1 hypothetical protein CMZ81_10015 [Xanthomonadaceae bacterium NML93-0793]PBS18225.1 hypothetical protein CMZ80_12805 [Xanthomonadaceae bacterium NML93-0831]